ncbi:7265_t:CDS:2 [Dentiscutata heterogama]|uniref:7265_t:CDS:1 n=1 Tax=Dentiscutata heterogama TaxID=1316150 RepID=A0ACA9K888_9GLOM|nr:7265_t:CDS:2 [Dentiscutata heterogama]
MLSLCSLNNQRFDVEIEVENRNLPEMEDLYISKKPGDDEFLSVDDSDRFFGDRRMTGSPGGHNDEYQVEIAVNIKSSVRNGMSFVQNDGSKSVFPSHTLILSNKEKNRTYKTKKKPSEIKKANGLTSTWKDYQTNATVNDFDKDNCQQFKDRSLPKFPFLAFDNLIFIMFQAFQLYFCFNAIFHEHIIQIITITVLNFCWALYGTVQAVEVKISLGELDELSNCVNKPTLVPNFWGNDIPCVLLFTFGVRVVKHFRQGLKEILNKNEVQQEEPPSQNPGGLAHIWDDLEFEPEKRKIETDIT